MSTIHASKKRKMSKAKTTKKKAKRRTAEPKRLSRNNVNYASLGRMV
jgi:hypothetical protein